MSSFCGPCELAEISEGKRLSLGPLRCLSTEPVTTPFIRATKSEVKERDSVHLTCDFNSSDSTVAFRWFHNGKGMEFTDRVFLIQNRILSILHARKEDSGVYQCEVYNAVSSKRSDPFRLNIRRE